jgi:hypothetical protein
VAGREDGLGARSRLARRARALLVAERKLPRRRAAGRASRARDRPAFTLAFIPCLPSPLVVCYQTAIASLRNGLSGSFSDQFKCKHEWFVCRRPARLLLQPARGRAAASSSDRQGVPGPSDDDRHLARSHPSPVMPLGMVDGCPTRRSGSLLGSKGRLRAERPLEGRSAAGIASRRPLARRSSSSSSSCRPRRPSRTGLLKSSLL